MGEPEDPAPGWFEDPRDTPPSSFAVITWGLSGSGTGLSWLPAWSAGGGGGESCLLGGVDPGESAKERQRWKGARPSWGAVGAGSEGGCLG